MKNKYRIVKEYSAQDGITYYHIEIKKKAGSFWFTFWSFVTLFRTESECLKYIDLLESSQYKQRLAKEKNQITEVTELNKYKYSKVKELE